MVNTSLNQKQILWFTGTESRGLMFYVRWRLPSQNISPCLNSFPKNKKIGTDLREGISRWRVLSTWLSWAVQHIHTLNVSLHGEHWLAMQALFSLWQAVVFLLLSLSQAYLSFHAQSPLPVLSEASYPGAGEFRGFDAPIEAAAECMSVVLQTSAVLWRYLGFACGVQ